MLVEPSHLLKKVVIIAFLLIGWSVYPPHILAKSVSNCEDDIENCLDIEQNENQVTNIDSKQSKDTTGSLLKGLLKIAFALLLILTLIYVMVKLFGRKNHLVNQTNVLENLGGISLGHNKSIQMIRIGDQLLLVGVGDNIELLSEITDEALIKQVINAQDAMQDQNSIVSTFMNKIGQKKTDDENRNYFKHLFVQELQQIKANRQHSIRKQYSKEDPYE